jgi:tetratricopeptide (TPR) repeat protein
MSNRYSSMISRISKFWILLYAFSLMNLPVEAQKRKRGDKIEESERKPAKNDEKDGEIGSLFIEAEKLYLTKNIDKSLEYFDKVLELDPSHGAANYKKAQILSDLEKNTEALPFARKAKLQDPKNKYYYILLAAIYTNLADLEMAAATYFQLVENVENTENYLFDLAALQLYQKMYEEALQTYTRAQEFFGPEEEIIFQKQKIYLKQNKLDLAITEGELLIKSNPGKSNYVAALAQILLSNNKPEQAKSYLETYVNKYGEDPIISVQLAEIYRNSGKVKEAILVLEAAFASPRMDLNSKISTLTAYTAMLPNEELVEPLIRLTEVLVKTHPEAYQSFATAGDFYLHGIGERELAKKNYMQALALNSSNFGIWQNIISIEFYLQEYKNIIEHTEKALEIFPNQGLLYYFSGTAYLAKKKYKQAIEQFEVGKPYISSNVEMSSAMNGQLGDAYNSIGNNEKSDASFEEALKQNPENDHVLNNYSYFLSLRQENLEKAEKMSTKLISLNANNPTYLDTHGWVLYVRKKYKEAKVYLEKAALADDSATVIEHYGDVLFQLGDVNGAIEQWKKARNLTDEKENLDKKIVDKQLYE